MTYKEFSKMMYAIWGMMIMIPIFIIMAVLCYLTVTGVISLIWKMLTS